MGDGGGGHWLVRMEWRPARWSVCLPLLIFRCTIKSRCSLLAPAHPGGPGRRAVKRLWCGVVSFQLLWLGLVFLKSIFANNHSRSFTGQLSFLSPRPTVSWSLILSSSISGHLTVEMRYSLCWVVTVPLQSFQLWGTSAPDERLRPQTPCYRLSLRACHVP